MRKRLISMIVVGLMSLMSFLCAGIEGQVKSPFDVTAVMVRVDEGYELSVSFVIPGGNYLYRDQISVTAAGGPALIERSIPDAIKKYDRFLEKELEIYKSDVKFVYAVRGQTEDLPLEILVQYAGCNDELCFMPESRTFMLAADGAAGVVVQERSAAGSPSGATGFKVVAKTAGYLGAADFIAFLDRAEAGGDFAGPDMGDTFEKRGLILSLLLIIVGGLALNLTPCVLPMIPVNLAIIGAGVQAGSRRRGFMLGAVYGAGIAFAYGLLGVLVVMTGARFGTLNASPLFNFAVALVFLLMSLSMFGVFNLDFTRLQSGLAAGGGGKGGFAAAFVLGSIAALLAGACVAPVVISVLLLAADMYVRGNVWGLFMPFLLGAGMALPWPFAGAGMSFLPRTGRWMEKVKYTFGVIILIFAAWYGYLGYDLIKSRPSGGRDAGDGWIYSMEDGFEIARTENKPVLVDFWATWCKNCIAMDETTFRDEDVVRRLNDYVKVRFDASNQGRPETKAVLDKYVDVGLPTFVILKNE